MIRTFIAIPVSCTPRLEQTCRDLAAGLSDMSIRWSAKENYHITLAFLGNTDEKSIPMLAAGIEKNLNGIRSFTMRIAGAGSFHNKAVWLGADHSEALLNLRSAVVNAVTISGYRIDPGGFFPHLTIGRPRQPDKEGIINKRLGEYKNHFIQEQGVDSVILYQSILSPEGPAYKALHTFRLL